MGTKPDIEVEGLRETKDGSARPSGTEVDGPGAGELGRVRGGELESPGGGEACTSGAPSGAVTPSGSVASSLPSSWCEILVASTTGTPPPSVVEGRSGDAAAAAAPDSRLCRPDPRRLNEPWGGAVGSVSSWRMIAFKLTNPMQSSAGGCK